MARGLVILFLLGGSLRGGLGSGVSHCLVGSLGLVDLVLVDLAEDRGKVVLSCELGTPPAGTGAPSTS